MWNLNGGCQSKGPKTMTWEVHIFQSFNWLLISNGNRRLLTLTHAGPSGDQSPDEDCASNIGRALLHTDIHHSILAPACPNTDQILTKYCQQTIENILPAYYMCTCRVTFYTGHPSIYSVRTWHPQKVCRNKKNTKPETIIIILKIAQILDFSTVCHLIIFIAKYPTAI